MSRVNLKIDKSTRERLQHIKRDGETWDDCLNRLAEYAWMVDGLYDEA